MNTVINIKTDVKIKQQAQRVAGDLGLTLSGAINMYLRQLVRTKTVFASTVYGEPSDMVVAALREAEEDKKNKRTHSFKNTRDALKFVDKIIAQK